MTVRKNGRLVHPGTSLFVAASDASSWAKERAWRVCDGTADEEEINLAIAALPAGGGKVVLSEGTFTLAAMIDLKNHCILEGQGKDVTTLIGHADYDDTLIENDHGGGHKTFFVLRDMTIDHGAGKTTGNCLRFVQATDVALENLRIRRGGVMNLYFEHSGVAYACKRIYVANCDIEDAVANDGFGGDGVEEMRIVGCRSKGNAGYGFGLRASRRIKIIACHSDDDAVGIGWEGVLDSSINGFDCNAPTGVAGVYITDDPDTVGISADIEIVAATVRTATLQGFSIDGDGTPCLRIGLTNCNALTCGGHGLRLKDAEQITLLGGHYRNNGTGGVAAGIGMVTGVQQLELIGVDASDDDVTDQDFGVWDGDSATNDYVRVIGGSFRGNNFGGVALTYVAHKMINSPDGYVPGATGILEGWVLDNAQNPTIGVLPQYAVATAVDLWVEEAFNAGGADDSLTVGWDADSDAFVATGLNMTTGGLREHITEGHGNAGATMGTVDATERSVEAYLTHSGAEPSAGKAHVIVHYIIATAEPA